MKAITMTTCAALLVAGLAGCSSSSTPKASNAGNGTTPAQSAASTTPTGASAATDVTASAAATTAAGASSGSYPNPCTLLSTQDALSFLGGATLTTKGVYVPDPAGHGGGCTWGSASGNFALNVGDPNILGPLAKAAAPPVSGLGDEAYASGLEVYFRKGSVGVRIIAAGHGKDAMVHLAHTALGNL